MRTKIDDVRVRTVRGRRVERRVLHLYDFHSFRKAADARSRFPGVRFYRSTLGPHGPAVVVEETQEGRDGKLFRLIADNTFCAWGTLRSRPS